MSVQFHFTYIWNASDHLQFFHFIYIQCDYSFSKSTKEVLEVLVRMTLSKHVTHNSLRPGNAPIRPDNAPYDLTMPPLTRLLLSATSGRAKQHVDSSHRKLHHSVARKLGILFVLVNITTWYLVYQVKGLCNYELLRRFVMLKVCLLLVNIELYLPS